MRRAALLIGLLATAWPCAAAAQPAAPAPSVAAMSDEERLAEAKRAFDRGADAFLAKRYVDALDALRASHRLVPSPNSMLLIARCLRALGRLTEAAATYQIAEDEAIRRGAEDASYAQTAAAARSEGAQVRAGLGTVRVLVKTRRQTTRLFVDGTPLAIPPDGEVLFWHLPGAAEVKVAAGPGAEEVRFVDVRAGTDALTVFSGEARAESSALDDRPPPNAASPPPPSTHGNAPWALPAAGVAGGVAIAGAVVFAVFGSASHSTYDQLRERCGPHACGPADREEADRGASDQRIANTGLAIGIVGAAAALAMLVVHFSSLPPRALPPTEAVR